MFRSMINSQLSTIELFYCYSLYAARMQHCCGKHSLLPGIKHSSLARFVRRSAGYQICTCWLGELPLLCCNRYGISLHKYSKCNLNICLGLYCQGTCSKTRIRTSEEVRIPTTCNISQSVIQSHP